MVKKVEVVKQDCWVTHQYLKQRAKAESKPKKPTTERLLLLLPEGRKWSHTLREDALFDREDAIVDHLLQGGSELLTLDGKPVTLTEAELQKAAREAYKRLEISRRSRDIKKETMERDFPAMYAAYERVHAIIEKEKNDG